MGGRGANVVTSLSLDWALRGADRSLAVGEVTYEALARDVATRAKSLEVSPGVVVAVSRTRPHDLLFDLLAVWHAGAVAMPVDTRSPREAITAQLNRARPALLIDDQGLHHRPDALPVDSRAALLLFTSGSTGAPKGVVLSAAGIAANVDGILEYLPVHACPDTAIVLPLVYGYALVGQALTTLRAGGHLHLLGDLAFPQRQLEAIAAVGRPVGLSSVPASLRRLAAVHRETGGPARIGYVASAGGRLDDTTLAETRAAFGDVPFFNQYGLTEASPRVTALRSDEPAFARGSVGRPLRGVEVFAVDEHAHRLGPGARGELCVRGPNVMLGYLRDEAGTRAVLHEGALRSGDTGFVDADGWVFVEGRRDSVVKVAGERVSLDEVADALRGVAGVREAQVFAVPDELLGARLVALVEAEPGLESALRACARTLPAHKRPQRFVTLPSLPRTANGKLDLGALRALAEST